MEDVISTIFVDTSSDMIMALELLSFIVLLSLVTSIIKILKSFSN